MNGYRKTFRLLQAQLLLLLEWLQEFYLGIGGAVGNEEKQQPGWALIVEIACFVGIAILIGWVISEVT